MAGQITAFCARNTVPQPVADRILAEQALRRSTYQAEMIDCMYGCECFCSREKINKSAKCCACHYTVDPRDGYLNVLAKMGPKATDPAGRRLWYVCMPCYFAWAQQNDIDPCEGSGCTMWRTMFYEFSPMRLALATFSATSAVLPPPPPPVSRAEVDALRQLIATLEDRVLALEQGSVLAVP